MTTTAPAPIPRIGRLATAGAVVVAVLVVGSFVSFVLRGDGVDTMFRAWLFHNGPVGLVGTTVMALALRRQPRNRSARMLYLSALAGGVHAGLMGVVYALADRYPAAWAALKGQGAAPADLPAALTWPLWGTAWLWLVSAGLVITLGLLWFPDGRLPSRGWRPAEWAGGAGIVLGVAGYAWGARPWSRYVEHLSAPPVDDPVAIVLAGIGLTLIGVAGLATIASLVVRLRASDPLVRAQVRPVVVTAVLAVATLVLLWPWQALWAVVTVPTIVLFVVTLGLTVARQRLFDVEIAVSRAVMVAVLGAFVTLGYVGLAATVGAVVGPSDSLIASVVATAVVAVTFDPVRRRVRRWATRLVTGARSSPDEVLAALSDRLARADSTDDVLTRVAQLLVDGTGATRAEVNGRHGVVDVAVGETAPGAAERAEDVTNEGEILGELRLLAERDDHFTSADERLLTRVAGTLGPVLRNAELTRDLEAHITELRASRRRLVTAQDEARRMLERDIHDGAQQELLALRLSLGLALAFADQGDLERTRSVLGDASARTDVAIRSLRELARGLHPPILAEQGLAAALHARARAVPLPVTIDTDGIGRFAHDVEGAAYFCCVEAMQNATKHARASRLGIELSADDRELRFTVTDDGAGFVPGATERGAGLTNMADRVEGLGGRLVVTSDPGAGTTVTGTIPVTVQLALSDR